MVIVGDDCALPPPRGIAGRRGLAGTLFVHKVRLTLFHLEYLEGPPIEVTSSCLMVQIAGAAAEAGLSLADVAAEAREVAGGVGTMGVGLTVCTPPGGVVSDRLGPTKMELGLGIVCPQTNRPSRMMHMHTSVCTNAHIHLCHTYIYIYVNSLLM